jgi:alkyl sulfatase BDS1-like metallo-beta-lactamase superfamily hydrolase
MNMHYPALRTLNLAETACHTMHNLCPLRGAKTRDSLAWARYLDQALDAFVPGTDALIVQHHWPVWGSERIAEYVAGQRDLYRYLHDQTLRLMSHGLTPREITDRLMLPTELSRQWFARGYYGAVAHNVNAVYAHYMGPYDGNPAHLNGLPPEAAGSKYVEYMGGSKAILERAQQDYDAGHFRWVVEVLDHVVFAEPGNQAARRLAATRWSSLATRPSQPRGETRTSLARTSCATLRQRERRAGCRSARTLSRCCRSAAFSSTWRSGSMGRRRSS